MSVLPDLPLRADLARRLGRPGPRYTSYPTAAHFTPAFGPDEYAAALVGSNAGGAPLSLYVHVPFCAALCHYCGCHVLVGPRPERVAKYLGYLDREVALVAEHLDPSRPVVQAHLGGGTPTTLGSDGIARLMGALRRTFPFADDAEVGIEADPRTLTPALLDAIAAAGFNRVSFGVQTFDEAVQAAIGRVQPVEVVERVVEGARRRGIEEVAFDLLYGLPHQTPASLADTLDLAVALAPSRVSVFGYAHVPWLKKHQRLIEVEALPGPAERLALFARAAERLTAAGYRHVGLDHFARPDDPLCRAQDDGTLYRNFQGYATHAGCDLLAVGVSAIGQLPRAYAQNHKGLPAYYAALDAGRLPTERGAALSDEDVLRRYVIVRLMCDFALDAALVEAAFGVDFEAHFADALESLGALEAEGLLVRAPGRIEVTPLGRLFVRNVAMAFDAYLGTPAEGPRYSQTV